jgi:adenylyltransferase/sulfurtransferase
VLGAVAGVLGLVQTMAAIQLLCGEECGLAGKLLVYDALDASFREIELGRNPDCPVCGRAPRIRELSAEHYDAPACETRS